MAKYYITACEEFYSDISSNRAIKIHLAEIQSMCPKYVQAVLQFQGAWRFKNQVKAIDTLNSLVTSILKGDSLPDNIKLLQESDYDEDEMKSTLGNAYATVDTFDWKVLEYRDATDYSDTSVIEDREAEDAQHVSQDTSKISRKDSSDSTDRDLSTVQFSDTLNENEFVQHNSTRADISLSFRVFPIRDIKTSGDLLKI